MIIAFRYAISPYLLTPYLNPANDAERAYNRSHKKTRCIVERALGIAKQRWRALDKSGGCLMYAPDRCIHIITACLILHNVCVLNNLPVDEEDVVPADENDEQAGNDINYPGDNFNPAQTSGRIVRQRLVEGRFTDQ
jgi:hypothetical protein